MAIAYHEPEVLVRDEPDRDLTPQRTAHRPGEARPHVLIVDDYEFNRNLLASPMANVPIVAVTTKAEPGDIARYLACGMSDVVAKPIKPSKLYEAMSSKLMPPEPIKRSWQPTVSH